MAPFRSTHASIEHSLRGEEKGCTPRYGPPRGSTSGGLLPRCFSQRGLIRVDCELAWFDPLLATALADETTIELGTFAVNQHPARHVAGERCPGSRRGSSRSQRCSGLTFFIIASSWETWRDSPTKPSAR